MTRARYTDEARLHCAAPLPIVSDRAGSRSHRAEGPAGPSRAAPTHNRAEHVKMSVSGGDWYAFHQEAVVKK